MEWEVTDRRKGGRNAVVLDTVSMGDWPHAIWAPCGSFALGEIAAVVFAGREKDAMRFAASEDLLSACKGVLAAWTSDKFTANDMIRVRDAILKAEGK